jgi:hypothetical protein
MRGVLGSLSKSFYAAYLYNSVLFTFLRILSLRTTSHKHIFNAPVHSLYSPVSQVTYDYSFIFNL